jgi:hypothetical protein
MEEKTTEQKLLDASTQASVIVQAFSPAAAEAIQAGVAVEPVISGLARLIHGLFVHHTK